MPRRAAGFPFAFEDDDAFDSSAAQSQASCDARRTAADDRYVGLVRRA